MIAFAVDCFVSKRHSSIMKLNLNIVRRKRKIGRAWRNRTYRTDKFGSYSHYKHATRNLEEARELLAQLQVEAEEKIRENLAVFEDSYSRNGYIPNSVAK